MTGRPGLVLVLGLVAAFLAVPSVLAGQPPAVHSVSEGRDPGSDRPVLSIEGKGLTQFVNFHLATAGAGTPQAAPEVVSRKSNLLALRLPPALAPGAYVLTVADKKGVGVDLAISIANGKPLPGSVEASALSPVLRADLDDAATLGGHAGAHYLDAGNLTGTLSTGSFSAFGDLVAEGKVGTGATQVAGGDHHHDSRYALVEHDHGQFVTADEVSAGYAPLDHDHGTQYAKKEVIGAKARRSGAFVATGGTAPIIPFNSEEYDTDGFYDGANPERLTCHLAGHFLVQASLSFQMMADFQIQLRKNGALVATDHFYWGSNHPGTATMTRVLRLEEGDYLDVRVSRINDSNGFTVYGNQDDDAASWFSIHLLGE